MLTDADCRNAVCPPEKKRARFTDAGGLYLEVGPGGSKRWFWKTIAAQQFLAMVRMDTVSASDSRGSGVMEPLRHVVI